MWPKEQRYPSNDEMLEILDRNPEEAAIRGKVVGPELLKDVFAAQPTLEGYPVRRLPRPLLELPRHLQARRKGNLPMMPRCAGAADDPEKFQKAGICRASTSMSAAVRGRHFSQTRTATGISL